MTRSRTISRFATTGSACGLRTAASRLLKYSFFVIPGPAEGRNPESIAPYFRMFMDSGQPPSKSAVADLAITQSISGEPEIDGFRNDAGEFFNSPLPSCKYSMFPQG